MSFTWKTEMRELLGAEGREDRLRGQAVAGRLEGGRWQLRTMPDVGTFHTSAVISDADARGLALAILRADLPEHWADLIEALAIMGEHPSSPVSPTHCEHDRLTVMADPDMFTTAQRDRLADLNFEQSEDGNTFSSNWYGSA